jgi:hypothetical protein
MGMAPEYNIRFEQIHSSFQDVKMRNCASQF